MECFSCGKYDHYARECRSASCYNCGKVGHITKFCRTEKQEKNILIEEHDEEEIRILMMMQNSDVELRSGKSEAKWRSGCVKERRSGDELSPGYLNRPLYCLKQSLRQWNKRLHEFITSIGFERRKYDTFIYFKFLVEDHLIIFFFILMTF